MRPPFQDSDPIKGQVALGALAQRYEEQTDENAMEPMAKSAMSARLAPTKHRTPFTLKPSMFTARDSAGAELGV